jgi:hypothetical protein
MFGGNEGRGMFGGGARGGMLDSIMAGIEVLIRTAGLFGFMGGLGGAAVGAGGGAVVGAIIGAIIGAVIGAVIWAVIGAVIGAVASVLATSGTVGLASSRFRGIDATLEARAGPTLGKKSFEGVEPAKYELLATVGCEGRIVMLGRLVERNGAGSERICKLVGRRRARAC